LTRLSDSCHRFGFAVIFFSRFLPMFRSLVPVFAGVSRLGFARTGVPVALAFGLWYGAILYAGAAAGQNWPEIVALLERGRRWLYLPVALAAAALLLWWWRSRHEHPSA
jgi:membrane protein DedA with SNARE-associated domain